MKLLWCRCDVCVDGPPKAENLKEEANILMQIIASQHVRMMRISIFHSNYHVRIYFTLSCILVMLWILKTWPNSCGCKDSNSPFFFLKINSLLEVYVEFQGQSCFLDGSYDDTYSDSKSHRLMQKPNLRMFVSKLREQVNTRSPSLILSFLVPVQDHYMSLNYKMLLLMVSIWWSCVVPKILGEKSAMVARSCTGHWR